MVRKKVRALPKYRSGTYYARLRCSIPARTYTPALAVVIEDHCPATLNSCNRTWEIFSFRSCPDKTRVFTPLQRPIVLGAGVSPTLAITEEEGSGTDSGAEHTPQSGNTPQSFSPFRSFDPGIIDTTDIQSLRCYFISQSFPIHSFVF